MNPVIILGAFVLAISMGALLSVGLKQPEVGVAACNFCGVLILLTIAICDAIKRGPKP